MGPSLVETATLGESSPVIYSINTGFNKDIFVGSRTTLTKEEIEAQKKQPAASYPNYLPTWDNKKYPPSEPFEHYDHGKDADPAFPDLLPKDKASISEITPSTGSEIHGVQLSQLNEVGKDQLALLVAQRKVVVFRDQDFAKLPIDQALEFGRYFGRIHIHPTSGAPKGYPGVHLVYRDTDLLRRSLLERHTNSVIWHSDVSYEEQPPGTTLLYLLDGPITGGDTLFCNTAKAYELLSPDFRRRLHGLKAVHSGFGQAQRFDERNFIAT